MMAFQSLTLKLMVIGSLSMIGCTQKEFKVSRKLASNRLVVNAESGENPVGVIGSDPTQTPVPTITISPTSTPVPTGTILPTSTPQPTGTIVPTVTPQPTGTIVPTTTPKPTATIVPTTTPKPTATISPTPPPVVNGECGSANGKQFAYPPMSNLCAKGTPSPVTGTVSGFSWTCAGTNGGSAATCSGTITSTTPSDIPLWLNCKMNPTNTYYEDQMVTHDPSDTIFQLRRTSDLKLICQIDKAAIGTLSEYGRPDVSSLDMNVINQQCGQALNRDGNNSYRVFIMDRAHLATEEALQEKHKSYNWNEEDNMLLVGQAFPGSQYIGGIHEQASMGFHLVRYNSKTPWCLSLGGKGENSNIGYVDCGDKVDTYLQNIKSAKPGTFDPDIAGGYHYSSGGGIWSFGLAIVGLWNKDPNLDKQLLLSLGNKCQTEGSPLLIDTRENVNEVIEFSSPEKGVAFDLLGQNSFPFAHAQKQISWIKDPRIMFLVKPNAKGEVNGINEMFGDNTAGPDGKFAKNGYLALAKFKLSPSDTSITEANPVFKELRLWSDKNLDGKAQAHELLTLQSMKIKEIKLGYDVNYKKVDAYGNKLMFRSEVVLSDKKTLPMYDVFFKFRSINTPSPLAHNP